jgi:hypothetical protein
MDAAPAQDRIPNQALCKRNHLVVITGPGYFASSCTGTKRRVLIKTSETPVKRNRIIPCQEILRTIAPIRHLYIHRNLRNGANRTN